MIMKMVWVVWMGDGGCDNARGKMDDVRVRLFISLRAPLFIIFVFMLHICSLVYT